MRLVAVLTVFAVACSTTSAAAPAKRTMPSPLVAAALPARPDAEPIPGPANWVMPVEVGDTATKAGILMSQEKALRAAHYLIAYDELRKLYEVDLRTWGREREIYERTLEGADQELARVRQQAVRSWFEQHAPGLALAGGVIVGAVITVGIVAAVHGTQKLTGP
jgi:hypothetical protein